MQLFFLLNAVGHLPIFPDDSAILVEPEPSQAFYMKNNASFTIEYQKNDQMFVEVLLPYKNGFRSSRSIKNVSISYSDSCLVGTPISSNSHNKFSAPNTVMDEPWGTGSYRTALTVVAELKADAKKTCVVNVTVPETNSPYVFVVGTEEDVLLTWLVGLPFYVTMVSSWNNNYLYGELLLACFLVTFLLVKMAKLNAYWLINATLLATVLNRAIQYEPAGWARTGPGIAFIVGPIFAMLVVALAFSDPTKNNRQVLAIIFLLVLPTHSWFDVVAASLLYAKNIYSTNKLVG